MKECLCLNCIYGNQPYGYLPIICAHGKRIKEMWHEVYTCKYYEACPPEPPRVSGKPWSVIICEDGNE